MNVKNDDDIIQIDGDRVERKGNRTVINVGFDYMIIIIFIWSS